MDISPGDSTPTSEASYSHTSTPKTNHQINDGSTGGNVGGPIPLMATSLPRLTSHPSTPTNSQLQQHFQAPPTISNLNSNTTNTMSSLNSGNTSIGLVIGNNNSGNSNNILSQQIPKLISKNDSGGICTTNLPVFSPSTTHLQHQHQQNDIIMLNQIGPQSTVTLANLPKILSQITGNKTIDQNELNPQKALQTINNALLMSSRQHQQQQQLNLVNDTNCNNTSSLR